VQALDIIGLDSRY